jgi:sugar diacid utilization regulator
MDEVMQAVLEGHLPGSAELTRFLSALKWQKDDRLLCVLVQSQSPNVPAMTRHALHSDLFRFFSDSYILLGDHQQCLILNLSNSGATSGDIHHTLAPLCRDYCLYAGISSPVSGLEELRFGYYQAVTALNQAFQFHDERWLVSFSQCAVDYLLTHLDSPLRTEHLVSPDLLRLLEHDREKGTAYYETLREYLLQERDISRTSERLIIHRTTLLYRLKKMRAMLSADLDDPWQRLYLTLSLRILERE